MTRTVMILLAGFLLTLAAGGVLGRIAAPAPKPAASGPDGGWLAQQLQLDADQRAKVQTIWDQTHTQMDADLKQRDGINQQFQQDVLNLLNNDQKIQYRALHDKAMLKANAIDTQVQRLIDASIRQTKAILKPEQKDKYDQLLARFPTRRADDAAPDRIGVPPGSIELLSFDH